MWKADLEKERCVLTMICIQKKVVQIPCVNHFPELLIELLERFEFLARIWTIAITSLFISLHSCCFLCSLFVSCIVHLYPEIHDLFPRTATLLSVFSILIFPNSFLSHIPGLLSRF